MGNIYWRRMEMLFLWKLAIFWEFWFFFQKMETDTWVCSNVRNFMEHTINIHICSTVCYFDAYGCSL